MCSVILGALPLDKRVTKPMLRWVLLDLKQDKTSLKQGLLTVSGATLKFVSSLDSSDVILEHNVHSITSFTRCTQDRKCFFYLQRNGLESPLVMYAFTCPKEDEVSEL